jgi:hypothetical protein
LLEKGFKAQLLDELTIKLLCLKVRELLIKQDNVAKISAPVSLVGDVHGQFYDLLEIFKVGGDLPYTSYLFMGDYVD